ncbi:unnamed protein product [Sphagnum compactum]
MLFVQTLALSTLVEYFLIYTKLFAETATAVPNLPSKEQFRNALEHQFKPSSDGGDQDRSTPLSRTTQRSLSLPPWAPTRRSKQMRRLSSAPCRLQGEAKQDGPPQAAAAGFEGLVSTRISGLSLVLVQAGACAAGPGEGFLLELDGNANLQVGGKVPKVAIALTHFSILGLQARAVEVSHATIAVEKHHRWQEHQSSGCSSRIMGTPAVLTGILRGMHVVLCPRRAEDTWWEKCRASAVGEAEEAAAADDIPSSSSHDHSRGDGGNPPPVENLLKGRSSSTSSFLVQCLVSLALSAIRLELHNCSVTVLLHPYSNCRSYSCSLALNRVVLEEGCIENNTAGGGSGFSSTSLCTGLFGGTLTVVHSSWKQMGTCMTKQCILQQLTVQLKTLNSSDLSAVGGAATSSGEIKSFGTSHEQQQQQQGEEDLQGFGKDSSNLPLGKLDSLVHNRDQILLLEDVTIAIRMQDVEFQGVEGDILEAVIRLDAKDIDVLSVLVAQLQGTSIHLNNKAGAMASRSLNDDSIAAEDDHMVKQQSEKDREQNKDSLTIAAASQNQGLALNTNVTKSSILSTSSSNEQAMTQVSPSSVRISSAQSLFGVLPWRIWMQSFVHVIIFARERFLQVGLKSFEGVPRSMVKPWTWVLGLAQVSHIMKNTTTAEEIDSSSSTGTLASTTEAGGGGGGDHVC